MDVCNRPQRPPQSVAEGQWRSGKPEWGRKADPCRPRIRRTPSVNPASGLEVDGGGHGLYRNSFFEKFQSRCASPYAPQSLGNKFQANCNRIVSVPGLHPKQQFCLPVLASAQR